jgi:hypothetical protein
LVLKESKISQIDIFSFFCLLIIVLLPLIRPQELCLAIALPANSALTHKYYVQVSTQALYILFENYLTSTFIQEEPLIRFLFSPHIFPYILDHFSSLADQ